MAGKVGRPPGGPKYGGRQKGGLNKATRTIKELAEPFGQAAVGVLAAIMTDPLAPHPARVSAAQALLDRGFGKAHQTSDVNMTQQSFVARMPAEESKFEWIAKRANGAVETLQGYLAKAKDAAEAQEIKAWIEYAKVRLEPIWHNPNTTAKLPQDKPQALSAADNVRTQNTKQKILQ